MVVFSKASLMYVNVQVLQIYAFCCKSTEKCISIWKLITMDMSQNRKMCVLEELFGESVILSYFLQLLYKQVKLI